MKMAWKRSFITLAILRWDCGLCLVGLRMIQRYLPPRVKIMMERVLLLQVIKKQVPRVVVLVGGSGHQLENPQEIDLSSRMKHLHQSVLQPSLSCMLAIYNAIYLTCFMIAT
mmetsp:Transcript_22856/g.40771  ORF Transcript_22856/g.40771 Transcript_22856/m.40771 type:complete len:112 (-) Transcript_22856:44-379(-)